MMKPVRASTIKLGMIYGGLAVAAVNPVAGAVTAFVLYRLYKSRKAVEDADRAQKQIEDREKFRSKFYARQRYASYEEYLASAEWHEKRMLVIDRCLGRCESPGCDRVFEEIHHKRYPHIWGNEPIHWLVVLCAEHHREAHGLSKRIVR